MTHGAIVLLGSANDVLLPLETPVTKLSLPIRAALAFLVALPVTFLIAAQAFVELGSLSPRMTKMHAELPLLAAILLVTVAVGVGAALAGRLCALACHGGGRADASDVAS